MTKRYIPVQAYAVFLECQECGKDMEFTGRQLLTYPAQYIHECKSCKEQLKTDSIYPKIEWNDENGDDVKV